MAVWSVVKRSYIAERGRLDAEYFTPSMLRLERRLRNHNTVALGDLGTLACSAFYPPAADLYEEGDLPFIRCVDVVDHIVLKPSQPFALIPTTFVEAHNTVRCLGPGDIVITKVGSPCYAGLVPAEMRRVAMSRTVMGLRDIDTSIIDPRYLVMFLRSKLGFDQLMRERELTIQYQLTLERTRDVRVLLPAETIQRRIGDMVSRQLEKEHAGHDLLEEAEKRLMEALGLNRLDLSPQKCYTRSFRDLDAANRFGAEYFMPCKKRILDALARMPHKSVVGHAPAIRELYDPRQARKGEMVRNFDVTDALQPFLDDSREPEEATEMGSAKKRFQAGDVVVSRLRSYLREIAVVRTSGSPQSVGSSEYVVLRPSAGGMSPETLMVFLRSTLVQTILKWSQDGSNHPRFTEEDLLSIPVPDKVLSAQKQIDRLVNDAIDARREAAALLERAKKAVEELISDAGRAR